MLVITTLLSSLYVVQSDVDSAPFPVDIHINIHLQHITFSISDELGHVAMPAIAVQLNFVPAMHLSTE